VWKSDGTEAGTVLVKDINPGAGGSNPSRLVNVNGTLFFLTWAPDGVGGPGRYELWKSDGTAAGTVEVTPINPQYGYTQLVNASGTLFFLSWVSDGGPGRYKLWKSDGTAAGTVVVKDLVPNENGFVFGLVSFNNRVIFTFHDDVHGYELWQSDGTTEGTVPLKASSGVAFSNPSSLFSPVNVNGRLYFSADDGVHGVQLWKYEPDINGLSVRHSGANIVVSWPSVNTADFTLEQTGMLNAPVSWVENTDPVIDDGVKRSVIVPATNNPQFFRLRRP